MPGIRRLFRLAVRRRDLAEAEMDEEIRAHLAMRVERLMARGHSRADADAEALRRFGSLHTARVELLAAARHRDGRLTMIERLDTLRQDLRAALHQIRRAPAFAAMIVATFALGIGANATMFGIVDRLLLRPPPHVVAPEQIVYAKTHYRARGEDRTQQGFSYPSYLDLRDHVPALSGVAMFAGGGTVSLGRGTDARPVATMLVSGNYFSLLGVRPALGRLLVPADDQMPNGSPVAVIGYGLWQRTFGGDPHVLGRVIMLGRWQYTVIGVAPRGFVGASSSSMDVVIPVSAAEGMRFAGTEWATNRHFIWMSVIARIADDRRAPLAVAQATAAYRAGARTVHDRSDTNATVSFTSILPQRRGELSPAERVAALLGGVSAFVLLIAAANVANLLLVRSSQRRREIAVRVALGISRGRLVRQLVSESLMLALLGGLAALGVVRWGSLVVQRVLLSDFPWPDSPIDGRVLAFTMIAATLVGVLAGMVPAFQGSAPALTSMLKDGSRGAGFARSRTRVTLLLVQAALSTVLLVGTGLFVRSLRNVHGVELGVDVDRLVFGQMDQRAAGLDSAGVEAYFAEAEARVERLPGVARVVVAVGAPFTGWQLGTPIHVPGHDSAAVARLNGPNMTHVTAGYFATVGTRIVRGRDFTADDTRPGGVPVLVINQAAARLLWPHENALGQCIRLGDESKRCVEIVGIARDTHRDEVAGESPDFIQLYLPAVPNGDTFGRMLLVRARAGTDPDVLVEPVRRVMQSIVPNLPYAQVEPMHASLDGELRPWRLGATMFSAFGAIALVLSALGLYGVVAFVVVQRTHEMGVRIALGARRGDILRLVLGHGFRVALGGVALGSVIALSAGRLVAPMLFNVSPHDPLVFAIVVLVLIFVAATASVVPARRASRSDPLTSLRSD